MGEELHQRHPGSFPWVGCLACGGLILLLLLVAAAIAIPNLIQARKQGAEAAPIGALKTITTAQSIFREGDKESDGNFDYGSLAELSNTMMIDGVLGSGTKQGYHYRVWPSPTTPEFLWFATAEPVVPGLDGDRYFCVNQAGVIHYRLTRPFRREEIGPDCAIPQDPDTKRVGK